MRESTLMFMSAAEVALLLRSREVSSSELTTALFDRIESVNPDVNAVVELRREQALAEAAAADRATARGEAAGPLHGVPVTVKEAFNVAGMHTTWGSPAFKDFTAAQDAVVVGRLKRAGAVIAGKTNVATMLADFAQTVSDLYGVTCNPFDPTRSPGGSSGGSAASLAAGLTFLEYGSDLVGSIRIPASFCGVYGLRPTAGTVPLNGFAPAGAPTPARDLTYLSTAGPLARSAADLRTAWRATADPADDAPKAYSWTLPQPRCSQLSGFRIGVVLDDKQCPVSGEIGDVVSAAVDSLARAGAAVVEGWPDGIDPAVSAASFGFQVGLFFAYQQPGAELPAPSQMIEQENARLAARAAWDACFADVDVFLCPVNFTPAFPHDARPFAERCITTPEGTRRYDEQPFWTAHPALAGLPAVAAPVGQTRSGLPVGIQVIGPRYEDDTAITFAELLAEVVGGFQPPLLAGTHS
jgi:amidase